VKLSSVVSWAKPTPKLFEQHPRGVSFLQFQIYVFLIGDFLRQPSAVSWPKPAPKVIEQHPKGIMFLQFQVYFFLISDFLRLSSAVSWAKPTPKLFEQHPKGIRFCTFCFFKNMEALPQASLQNLILALPVGNLGGQLFLAFPLGEALPKKPIFLGPLFSRQYHSG